ncbi:hypothetical protein D3C86_1210700 [compost metagenome]
MPVSRRILPLVLLLTACGAATPPISQGPSRAKVSLAFARLLSIEPMHGHYAAWAVLDGDEAKVVPIGAFLVDGQGGQRGLDGMPRTEWPVAASPQRITEVFVTQELPGTEASQPSRQEFLRGTVHGGSASLAAPIVAESLAGKSGVFLLDNPVTYKDPTDYNGVWFARLEGRYFPGLDLDESPVGWMYAGWVILNGTPLRVGKFAHPADSDDWAGYSGRSGATELINPAGSPMPGEDFITNLPPGIESGWNKPALAGATVLVTLESATLANQEQYPSPIRLFEGTVPASPSRQVMYPFENVAATRIPAGTATVK